MKVASSIVLNIERARETGELDYLETVRLCCEALRALQFLQFRRSSIQYGHYYLLRYMN